MATMPALSDQCEDGCVPKRLQRRFLLQSVPSIAFGSLPFTLTFVIVGTVALHRLYPLLAGHSSSKADLDPPSLLSTHASRPSSRSRSWLGVRPTARRLCAVVFSTTIGLAAVLAELILCEISNAFDPETRGLVLQFTISCLLILLVIVTPLLQLHAIIVSLGWDFAPRGGRRLNGAWVLEMLGFAAWISAFWWIGQGLPGSRLHQAGTPAGAYSLSEACLERVGIIGISLMALLSGFASVSSLWQSFGIKVRAVTDADIARKQAGLEASMEMLESKRGRLRALERKMADGPPSGFVTKMMGSLRGDADRQERRALLVEIAGLETMSRSLTTSLSMLRTRRQGQQRAATPTGQLVVLTSYSFSVYCLYRILATTAATLRRWWRPETTFAGADPINNLLALVAKHWDPTLDRLAWSRQISFLLSGVILLASLGSVVQTVHFFARFTPGLMHQAQANVGLLVSQIGATYVISSALLLRSNLPREVGRDISAALGAPLDSAFVDRWFESWFLTASGLTAVGIVMARKVVGGGGEWDEEPDGLEEEDVENAERGGNKRS